MLDKDRIFMQFLTMSGLEEAKAHAYRPLCEGAGQYLIARLRGGAQIESNMERLCMTAAALAYGDWLEIGGSLSTAQEIRVGDITLREREGVSAPRGRALREHFLAGISDLLEPSFAFTQVREETP